MRTGVFGVALGLTLSLAIGGARPLAQGGGSAAQPATKKPAPAAPQKPATAAPQKPTPQKPAASTPAKPATAAIEKLVSEAEAAREANRPEEALALYEKAVKLQPGFVEGHWYIGTINYELDRYGPARDAFRRVTTLAPENGAAWTLKGLCEFQLKNYDRALADLLQGRQHGVGGNRELASVGRYHTALLLIRLEEFEQGLQILNEFAQEGNDSPSIVEAMGLAALRLPMLPSELPGIRRTQVMLAGRASYFMAARLNNAAQKAFEELVNRYPETPHVHYAYGVFLTSEQPDDAIVQFQQELKVSPRHPWAKMQLAYEYIRRGDWESARPWAEQAVEEAPNVFVARRALGQVLLETGDIEGAIRELEAGVKMEPNSPAMRFSLARAYRRAGRAADAEREQVEFTRLERMVRRARSGPQAVGGIELDAVEDTETAPQQ
jgi:tetratricopeptide (TPR) repeat protein